MKATAPPSPAYRSRSTALLVAAVLALVGLAGVATGAWQFGHLALDTSHTEASHPEHETAPEAPDEPDCPACDLLASAQSLTLTSAPVSLPPDTASIRPVPQLETARSTTHRLPYFARPPPSL